MIVVRIELWPFGNYKESRLLGICKIINDGTGDPKHGNYKVTLSHSGNHIDKKGTWKKSRVEHHRRSLSPYHLVYKALKTCLWPKKEKTDENQN